MSQNIVRHEPGPILSRAVEYNGMVFVAGLTADDYSLDIKGQTEQVLKKIDKYLAAAGSNKTRLPNSTRSLKGLSKFAAEPLWMAMPMPGRM